MGELSMKKQTYFANTALTVIVGITCLAAVLLQTFAPRIILPEVDLPMLMFFGVLALLIEGVAKGKIIWPHPVTAVLAGLSFSILPWCAGLIGTKDILVLFLNGVLSYAAAGLLLGSVARRLPQKKGYKVSLVLNGGLLILASQVVSGLLLFGF